MTMKLSEKQVMISSQLQDSFANKFMLEVPKCSDFGSYIKHFSESFASLMTKIVSKAENTFEENYLFTPCEAFFANPGKCARPLVCMLSNCAFDGKVKESILSSVAIEMFQNAALIHDDIADDATLRRNKLCMHVTEGLGIALNAGDFALCLVDELVMRDNNLSDTLKLKVLQELSIMKLKTITGQAIDIGWSRDRKFDLNADDYFNMATLKTAHYTCSTPIVVGAMIAGVDKEVLERLRSFGTKCGLAFQIQDDILNVDKNSNDTSKDFALDIQEGKRTLIAIHAINKLPAEDAKLLIEILNKKHNSVEEVQTALCLMEKSDSINYAKEECNTLIEEANDIISTCENSSRAFQILRSIPNWCLSRRN